MSRPRSLYRLPFRFIPIATNFIDDGWIFDLTHNELKVLLAAFRFTWGHRKESDTIALNQFAEKTHLSIATVKRAIAGLRKEGILNVSGPQKRPRTYKIDLSRRLSIVELTKLSERLSIGELSEGSAMMSYTIDNRPVRRLHVVSAKGA